MTIIKQDINFLKQHVPDIDWLFKQYNEIFDVGGFVCGGSLRRAIRRNSIHSLFSKNYVWLDKYTLEQYISCLECNKGDFGLISSAFQHQEHFSPDIDFYFSSKEDYEAAVAICETYIQNGRELAANIEVNNQYVRMIFAKNYVVSNGSLKYNLQLILPETSSADPETTIRNFDFINCQLALTKDHFYYNEDFFQYEKLRQLKINPDRKSLIWISLIRRVAKYLSLGDYDSLCENDRENLIAVAQKAEEYKYYLMLFKIEELPYICSFRDLPFMIKNHIEQKKSFNGTHYKTSVQVPIFLLKTPTQNIGTTQYNINELKSLLGDYKTKTTINNSNPFDNITFPY